MTAHISDRSNQFSDTAPARAVAPAVRIQPRYSLPVLWHLLSLDAPTVATVWFLLAARTAHLHLLRSDAAALFLATWMFYVIDRLLDVYCGEPHPEERHRFHGEHSKAFFYALLCAAPVLLLLLSHMGQPLRRAWLLLGLGSAGYYAWVHTRDASADSATRVPKEICVGMGFTLAIFLPEALSGVLRPLLPQILCFFALCCLNCILIYEREHHSLKTAHWSTRFAIRHASLLQATLLLCGLALCFTANAPRTLSASIVLSAAIMMALRRSRHRIPRLSYRIAADAALLSPLLFLFG
ncbi:MAG TPA: hypothetical protein VGB94_08825 [Acidobacteriaceae bacterium]